ncbi:S-adenosyl-L-methionine-dependent methyltransferase [Amylocarpus encephaloides]|uniref:S-adenosyl-L-methionine-dependent methyltransferase n=1 Tax=Amylocarpus encephaloides TaxID=45428 RepID=A0A9P7Y8Y8_9HELO|nr:S-adenosyl-L-methionine-dependent methyltransferase [Amylocarpus encephaloides]
MTFPTNDRAVSVNLVQDKYAAPPPEIQTSDDTIVDINDAGYETDSSNSSISTSLSLSVVDYPFENGRRYHKFREGRYCFPNDELEQEREDRIHELMVYLFNRLHFAPVGVNPKNILDLVTGTGMWAIEIGNRYPNANVLGVDLSAIQPEWVPPNVRFMVDDVESEWAQPRNHFDYINSRNMVLAVRSWPRLFRQALRDLKPGAWMEMQEFDHLPQSQYGSIPLNHPVSKYWDLLGSGLSCLGVNSKVTVFLADMMRDAGFQNVSSRILRIPIGEWPEDDLLKMVGRYFKSILIDGIQSMALRPLTRGLMWSREEVEVWLVEERRAYKDDLFYSHMPLHIISGQKPSL